MDGVNFEPTQEELRKQRLDAQEKNRENYQYRKYLKNRYNAMQDKIQNSAERYKSSTIDLSLPEVGYVENKKQHFTGK